MNTENKLKDDDMLPKAINVLVPTYIWRNAKIKATSLDTSLKDYIISLIKDDLAKK